MAPNNRQPPCERHHECPSPARCLVPFLKVWSISNVSISAIAGIIGQSEAMQRVFGVMQRVAASDSTVLINGETGTGKGLAA
ncbi:MAG: sigma 54-interacting transcriptional regulator, partial [Desulfobacterales bacterium]|nr:sigma 54-interacting transcriptional regulator [Desulfobacterales bacterium]